MGERKGMKGLELWCRKMTEGYPGVKIENMTTSWRDGLAFCAIIHHFRPDLIDFDKLNKDDIYHNNELAYRVAEHHLGIPALLEAEDMVEFEVPDRLSILTYLSQFYQAFEVQRGKSGARMAQKRPETSPDHGIVSPASTSPPTKVQITVGKSRREPCAKCGLPVFIAERLNVGKQLYHRTCFRCARCQSQLTLANYYETENGEFCCEICPDEEKLISKKLVTEHSVLMRSMSDEEKSASLHNRADLPDAYSAHFETALEYPVDNDLKRNFTLTQAESTEFTKARNSFFQSQIEDSSDSGNEDIPPDLPQSKPPPLKVVQPSETENKSSENKADLSKSYSDSGFPKNKQDVSFSDSVSIRKQTNDNFVTKDNVSSPERVSVRARMKLFENNEDKKSDVNSFIHSNKVPLDSPQKKKATVVAIDDLEDFDNISRKDIEFNDTPLDKSNRDTKHSENRVENKDINTVDEKVDNAKTFNIDINGDKFSSNLELRLAHNIDNKEETEKPLSDDNKIIHSKQIESTDISAGVTLNKSDSNDSSKEPSHITILDSSHETSHILIEHSAQETSHITIHDSSLEQKEDQGISTDSFLSAEAIKSIDTNSSSDFIVGSPIKRGYYTAYEILSPQEIEPVPSERDVSVGDPDLIETNILDEIKIKSEATDLLIEQSPDDIIEDKVPSDNETSDTSKELNIISGDISHVNENEEVVLRQHLADTLPLTEEDKSLPVKKQEPPSKSKYLSHSTKSESYPEDLNPFGDDEETKEPSVSSASLNPFGDPDIEENVSPKPTPAPRPKTKKKILPSLDERVIHGTPEALSKIYMERISYNPFEDDEDEDKDDSRQKESISPKPVPSPRFKKKLVPVKISMNPFESDDEEEGADEEEKIVPVPKPRNSKTSPATHSYLEPRPRDSLSITSRGSHGGSTTSISSGSAVGSARKKKPAPRPPVPFKNSEQPSSLTVSPSQSLSSSPAGTIRSKKTKRAPLPPNASTPSTDKNDLNSRLDTIQLSPISSDTGEVPHNTGQDDIQQEKNVKDEENRNRQSQNFSNIQSPSSSETDSFSVASKSMEGRWKRKKGQAPTRPIPQRRIVKTLPMSEIRRELDTIEIQQQGLEKQGVRLEQIIREKCEGGEESEEKHPDESIPIEVEDLILQLFELVNEKNELFRRQAELMYLRRQQRLEEEHADVEYQIRCLMLQPEANKTDSDKAREEALINRLVEIVERRNEIIECLEMDRVREVEEDNSISSQLNLYSLKRENEKDSPKEEGKKDKKKKHKKLNKIIHTLHKHKEKEKEKEHKVDVDKDIDETEVSSSEKKKKKKFNLF